MNPGNEPSELYSQPLLYPQGKILPLIKKASSEAGSTLSAFYSRLCPFPIGWGLTSHLS